MRKKFVSPLLLPLLSMILLVAITEVCARAGGGGGNGGGGGHGHSGGGSGGGDAFIFQLALRIFIMLPFPLKIVVLLGVVGAVVYFYKNQPTPSVYREVSNHSAQPSKDVAAKIIKSNPDFSESGFLNHVSSAFYEIQKAWNNKDLSTVRRYISDGVWQRFTTQFLIMDQLKQTNRLENICIHSHYIDSYEKDGDFDIVHVAIKASLMDYFECELDRSMNSGGPEVFTEYWSFIKRRGAVTKDIYSTLDCPSCGAAITETMGELARCPYCSTLLNSGEYDWVLSEITQAIDYAKSKKEDGVKNLSVKRKQLVSENEDFSVQQIEDHVSNGYVQIIAAKTVHDTARMKRFVSQELFAQLSPVVSQYQFLYNRFYFNEVTLIAAEKVDNQNRLYVRVTSTAQRVQMVNSSLRTEDPLMRSETEIVRIVRSVDAQKSRGSLFMHQCPSCGASVDESVDTNCLYCGSVITSSDKEWLFDAILSPVEYLNYISEHKKRFDFMINQKNVDELMSVKEYAIGNIMAIIAADGKMTEEEELFLDEFATKLKFKKAEKVAIKQLAQQNRLQIRFPEDQNSRVKIYNLMVQAANSDGEIHIQEQQILDYVQANYLTGE